MRPMTAVFSSTGTYFSFNHPFWLVETRFLSAGNSIVLFRFFFNQQKLLLKSDRSQFLQTNHIPVSGHQFFESSQRPFKREAAILSSGNVFFNKFFIRLKEAYFVSNGNSAFFIRLFFCQLKPVLELGETSFQKKKKRLFQQNSSFQLAETDFRRHNGLPQEERLYEEIHLKKYVSTTWKSYFHRQKSLKNQQEIFSNGRREAALKKWFHLYWNNDFYWHEICFE